MDQTDPCDFLDLEVEQDEMSRANPPVHLTRELWVRFSRIASDNVPLFTY